MRFLLLILLCSFIFELDAQIDSPKREFRGFWVATVANIDYPKRPPNPMKVGHQEQWKNLLDKMQAAGFNAVIAQIRPSGDAFYPTDLAPWSYYLTGKQGMEPQPSYDPLEFMIEEAHKRSMEFHAWFNPYRATVDLDTMKLAPNHAFYRNRKWMIKYGNKYYFNPASEEVRQYLTQVVSEVVSNYDIDAVHFDDYFYPYPIKGEVFQDSSYFERSKGRFSNIADWRRNNVDQFIEQVSLAIKSVKPFVKLGVSPFGVWSNKNDNRMGSDTRASIRGYDDLYADVLKWLRLGWIDYVVPQLYWNIGFEPADHKKLLEWWANRTSGRHLYVGHGAYKVGDNAEVAWDDPQEIPDQIRLSRKNINAQGSSFYSAFSLIRNRLGVRDSIRYHYRKPALVPEMDELSERAPNPPRLKPLKQKNGHPKLVWKPAKQDISKDKLPAYYAIYRFKNDQAESTDEGNGNHLLQITPFYQKGKKFKFIDQSASSEEFYTYVITGLNRLHNESKASNPRTIYKTQGNFSKVK